MAVEIESSYLERVRRAQWESEVENKIEENMAHLRRSKLLCFRSAMLPHNPMTLALS